MQPQKILLINDVAFCAKDALRLLSHSADIACGLDFAHNEVGAHRTRGNSSSRSYGPRHKQHQLKGDTP